MNRWYFSRLWEENTGDNQGGGGGGGFDAESFKRSILEAINTTVNKAVGGLRKEFEKKIPAPATAPSGGEGEGGEGSGGEGTPKPQKTAADRRVEELQKKFDESERKRKESEDKARQKEFHSTVREGLSQFQYAKADGASKAFKLLISDLKLTEDGEIETPDGSPLAEFLSMKLTTEYDELLAPKSSGGGSHATPGGARGKSAITLDMIKPGMSAEDSARIRAEIARVAREAMGA